MPDIIVEIPYNSYIKYEFDKSQHKLRCDRILGTAMCYPGNYGYFPNTLACDGDPLDVLLVTDYSLHPGCVVDCKIIGVLLMTDEAGLDEKIIAVPSASVDVNYACINALEDLPPFTLKKIRHFFTHYKDMEENKWCSIEGFRGAEHARSLLEKYKTTSAT